MQFLLAEYEFTRLPIAIKNPISTRSGFLLRFQLKARQIVERGVWCGQDGEAGDPAPASHCSVMLVSLACKFAFKYEETKI
jgi:hypothetical protein